MKKSINHLGQTHRLLVKLLLSKNLMISRYFLQRIPIKLKEEKNSNFIVKKCGRHCLSQVIKVKITINGDVLPNIMYFLRYSCKRRKEGMRERGKEGGKEGGEKKKEKRKKRRNNNKNTIRI